MANSSQAKKRVRQAEEHRQRNASQLSAMRTHLKKALNTIAAGDKTQAEVAYKAAVPLLDRAARKGLIHANKAARHKSQLTRRLRGMQP